MAYAIAAFYRFTPVADPAALRAVFLDEFAPLSLCGTLLIAPEGINGTLAGSDEAVARLLEILEGHTGLMRADVKFSHAAEKPFNRLKIRLKKEIITLRQADADPARLPGTYVAPRDWNTLLDDESVTLLDTRNAYETAIGIFRGARDPGLASFSAFAGFVQAEFDPRRHAKIAMYCTGGIRCEKAAAFMRAQGFTQVYHLKGGILKYLEEVPEEQSRWQGECYVFDRRMAVSHGLKPGSHSMCFCCGYPLSASDRAHPLYEAGVSCARCHAASSASDKARFRMRQGQLV